MNNLIAVFDCSSKGEGASIALALLKGTQFRVRVITEYFSMLDTQLQQKSHQLERREIDWNNLGSIENAIRDAYGCFLKTKTDFSKPNSMEDEMHRGKLVADACKRTGISHLVFSTQLNTKLATGIVVRHMVAKAMTEEYIRNLALPLTSIIVPVCYEDFIECYKPLRSPLTGFYEILIPMGLTPLDMVSREDVGHIVAQIFQNRPQFLHQTVSLSGDKLTMKQVADYLSRSLQPIKVVHRQITTDEFSRTCGLDGASDLASMFNFLLRVDQRHWTNSTRNIYPPVKSFQDWVTNNRNMLRNMF